MTNFKKSILTFCTIISISCFMVGCINSNNEKETKVEGDYLLELVNDTRFFKSEAIPKSDAENIILDYFKIEISDDYDNFKNVFIDNEAFNYYPQTYRENFNEGLYTEEITIHSLKELSTEEFSNDSNGIKYYYFMNRLTEYHHYEFKIIEVNYTNKLTDKFNEIAQWGSGNWIRYFVVVKENKDSGWRIFDVYGHM